MDLNNIDIIKLIFNKKYDLNYRDILKCNTYYCKNLSKEIIEFIVLNLDINIDNPEEYSVSLIGQAVMIDDFEIVKYLATYKYASKSNISRALMIASDIDNIEIVNYLLENDADEFSKNYHKINIGIKNNDLHEIKKIYNIDPSLLQVNNDIKLSEKNNLLCKAAKNNCIDIIKYLITLPDMEFTKNLYNHNDKIKFNYHNACL